jgi:hypothetical protein
MAGAQAGKTGRGRVAVAYAARGGRRGGERSVPAVPHRRGPASFKTKVLPAPVALTRSHAADRISRGGYRGRGGTWGGSMACPGR